ncbi:MAG: flavodoxin family protein [Spirochaetes bacterium]|nr:flavodoxin family protein [Spirochaetota bacterium]
MKVLGIYGSPREGGNTDLLLDSVLDGAASAGAMSSRIYVREMNISGCIECGGCDQTGVCVVRDDMQDAYDELIEARVIFLASPVFFYSMTGQVKLFIDRCQALWSRRRIEKTADKRRSRDGGAGYLIMAAAAAGDNLFAGSEVTARYFFATLDKSYGGGLFVTAEEKGDILKKPEELKRAFEFGRDATLRELRPQGGLT